MDRQVENNIEAVHYQRNTGPTAHLSPLIVINTQGEVALGNIVQFGQISNLFMLVLVISKSDKDVIKKNKKKQRCYARDKVKYGAANRKSQKWWKA